MTDRQLIEATCPECRGPLTEIQDDGHVEYECLVGHRYSPEALLHAHAETEERSLWSAVVALEEAQNIVNKVAPHLPPVVRSSLESEALQKAKQAGQIREILNHLTPFRTS
jgi:two-component system, chemotaxis family, protein-glutamate methylesterase/glutaminase